MTDDQGPRSEEIRAASDEDIQRLAKELEDLEIPEEVLKSGLESAVMIMRVHLQNTEPAPKEALNGLAKALETVIERVSKREVRERLVEAIYQPFERPDKDGDGHSTEWCDGGKRLDRAIEGTRDLVEIVRAGEAARFAAGRPSNDHLVYAAQLIVDEWIELGRDATISGHPNDPRGVRPSPMLRFVHACLRFVDEKVTVQTCRTVLQRVMADRKAQRELWRRDIDDDIRIGRQLVRRGRAGAH